jgi:hypothetical protein
MLSMNETRERPEVREVEAYRTPTVEVIALDCEISAYAPDDGDIPLF